MSNDALKLRVIEAYPTRWLHILHMMQGETNDEYKLRVMNISVPWTRNDAFRNAYLRIVSPWPNVKTTKLIMTMYESIGYSDYDENEKLVLLIFSYGYEYAKDFFNSFISNYFHAAVPFHGNYVKILSRALYRFDKNFYRTINVPKKYFDRVVEGIVIESALIDDEETFDFIIQPENAINYLYDVAKVSYHQGHIKYVKKILFKSIDVYNKKNLTVSKIYRAILERLNSETTLLEIGIKAIREISGESLKNLFEIVFIEFRRKKENMRYIYPAFYHSGLSVEDISQIVQKHEAQDTRTYREWMEKI